MLDKSVPARMEYMDGVLEAFRGYLEELDCPEEIALRLEIALEELFTNIASYAYEREPGQVRLSCRLNPDGKELEMEVEDRGAAFNPLDRAGPDFDLPIGERPVGGLGIYMVRQFVDKMEYEYRNGCNILRLKKRIHT
ncbi:MAG: ATP-binding protein [Clostridium sp.]|nr:ATP-binding protein [Clostridium sp.]